MNAPNPNRADYISAPPLALEIPSECAGLRLDQALARLLPQHSRSRLASWMKQGRVRLDDTAVEARRKVWGGERIVVQAEVDAQHAPQRAEAIPLRICHEDAQLLVIDKPAGLVMHPGNGNWAGTLLNALLHHAPELAAIPRAGIVHRLDKDTSGLVVVARTLEAQTALVRQLAARTVQRRYLALAHGCVSRDGTVDAPLGRHPVQRTRMAVVAGGRVARTHYRVRERLAGATLLECALETGRTHQIRVHLAEIGHPLIGDPVYGRRRPLPASLTSSLPAFSRQALHAWRLELTHPASGQSQAWESPLPEDFAALLAAWREGSP